MSQLRSAARRAQQTRDSGLRRLSGATVALTLTSLAGVGVVAAVVKSATEHSAQRSPTSATAPQTGQSDAGQSGGTGGSGSSGSGSSGSGSSGISPDQSGSGQLQVPADPPTPATGGVPNATSGGS